MMIVITIPLPAKVLHPNGRTRKHLYRAAAVKAYRRDCGIAALAEVRRRLDIAGKLPWDKATVQPVFYVKTNARRDKDGALSSIKAALDSLQDAGVIANDHGLTPLPVEFVKSDDPRVELVITSS